MHRLTIKGRAGLCSCGWSTGDSCPGELSRHDVERITRAHDEHAAPELVGVSR